MSFSSDIIGIIQAWILCLISECYKVSRSTFIWLVQPFLCQCVQKRQKCYTTPNMMKDEFGKPLKYFTPHPTPLSARVNVFPRG